MFLEEKTSFNRLSDLVYCLLLVFGGFRDVCDPVVCVFDIAF